MSRAVRGAAETLVLSRWSPAKRPGLSRAEVLFVGFATYLAAPLGDVPLLGISLSAPLLLLIGIEIATGRARASWRRHEKWVLLAWAFWTGCAASLAGNQFWGNQTVVSAGEWYMLIHFSYWMVAFLITLALAGREEVRKRVYVALGLTIVAVAGMRMAEGFLFGVWGEGNGRFFSQNDCGWQFSAFTPFAVGLALTLKKPWRTAVLTGLGVIVAAVAVNGSRGSWVAIPAGLGVLALASQGNQRVLPRLLGSAGVLLLAGAGLVWITPEGIQEAVSARGRTLENVDEDKTYAIRKLLVQKGLTLFQENPVLGVGLDRFARTRADLDQPSLLQYAGPEHFNVKSPHNSYIEVLAETGLAGSAPLAVLLVLLGVEGLRAALRAGRKGDIWPGVVYASFVSMSIHFWVLSGITGTAPWFVYGLLAAVTNANRRRQIVGVRRVVLMAGG